MTRRGTTLTCAGIFSVAVGLGIASAQSSPEHQFVPQAAMANMAEIQLGHLAIKKAQHPDVKKFAQTMIDDHLKAQNELADAASGANIQWPKQLDAKHRQIHQRLSTLNNQQFDHEYMKTIVDGHRDVQKLLAARAGAGGTGNTEKPPTASSGAAKSDASPLSTKVNQWAAKTWPAVQARLKRAEQIYGALEKGA